MFEKQNANGILARLILCRATLAILAANVLVWFLQLSIYRFLPRYPLDQYFGLSLDGLRHGFVWQLLTFQFMHGSWLHILMNSWAIFIFGQVVEMTIGWWRTVGLYFLSGVVGGLFQMLGTWLFPSLFGDGWNPIIGASAGATGLIAAFAMLYPREDLYLLLFFFIPLRMRARTLLEWLLAVTLFGIVQPKVAPHLPRYLGFADIFTNVAHAAHLGGMVTGCVFAFELLRRYRRRVPPVITGAAKSSLNYVHTGD